MNSFRPSLLTDTAHTASNVDDPPKIQVGDNEVIRVSWARADPYLTQALIGRNLLDMQTISPSPTVTADGVKAVPDQPFTRDLRRRLG